MSSAKPGVKRMSVTSAFTTEADAQLASMMHIQACCRRFVVLARVKRAKRAQEVARRKRRLQSSLSDADFVVGTQLLELFATHTEESTVRQPCDLRRARTGRVELLHQQEHEQHPGRDEGREARHQAHARARFAQFSARQLRRRREEVRGVKACSSCEAV